MNRSGRHLTYVITEDWFFASHFLDRAKAAIAVGYRVTVVTRSGLVAKQFLQYGIKVENFEFSRRGLNPLNEFLTVIRLCSVLRRIRPDIIHNIALKPIVLGSIAAKLAGVKNVVNAPVGMGYIFTSDEKRAKFFRPIAKSVLRIILGQKNSLVIIENSDDLDNLVSGKFANRQSISLVKSGVNLTEFVLTSEPEEPVKIIMVSRMLRDKGVWEFVQAARHIFEAHPTVRFWLVGDCDEGNPTSISRSQLSELNIEPNLEWLGARKNIAELLSQSHISCLPSYREGLPKSLIEAAAAGRPIVTTDVPGCREVVTEGVNGFLVPPRDHKLLAHALIKLIENPELRTKFGLANRLKAEREFSNECIADQTHLVYDSFKPK